MSFPMFHTITSNICINQWRPPHCNTIRLVLIDLFKGSSDNFTHQSLFAGLAGCSTMCDQSCSKPMKLPQVATTDDISGSAATDLSPDCGNATLRSMEESCICVCAVTKSLMVDKFCLTSFISPTPSVCLCSCLAINTQTHTKLGALWGSQCKQLCTIILFFL